MGSGASANSSYESSSYDSYYRQETVAPPPRAAPPVARIYPQVHEGGGDTGEGYHGQGSVASLVQRFETNTVSQLAGESIDSSDSSDDDSSPQADNAVAEMEWRAGQLGDSMLPSGGPDTSTDLLLSRIMGADEFLGRMEETEEKVRHLVSDPSLRGQNHPRVIQLLGLRGHLQDELIRIQTMVAEGDPKLKRLKTFENQYRGAKVLRNISKKYRIAETQVDDVSLDLPPGKSHGNQIGENKGQDMGTQYDGDRTKKTGCSIGTDMVTEMQLKEKHDKSCDNISILEERFREEEQHVSENFANKLLSDGDNPLAKNEVDRLLSDHMNSMLVLRKKQELEKIKVQAKNQEMVKARPGLVAAVAHNVPTPPPPIGRESKANNELPQTSTVPKQVQPEKDLEGVGKIFWTMKEEDVRETTPVAARKTSRQESDNEFDDEEEVWRQYQDNLARKDDSDTEEFAYSDEFEADEDPRESPCSDDQDIKEKEVLRTTLSENIWSNRHGMTSEDFKGMLDTFRTQEKDRRTMQDAEKDRLNNSLLSKLAQRRRITDGTSDGENEEDENKCVSPRPGSKSPETSHTGLYDENEEVSNNMDRTFTRDLAQRNRELDDAAFSAMLKRHLEEVDAIKKQRAASKSALDQKLQDRLRKRKTRKGRESEDESVSSGDDGDDDNEEMVEQLATLERTFEEKIRRKRRGMSEQELQALFDEYRRNQLSIIKQTNSQKMRLDDKLKQKMAQRRRKGRGNMEDSEEEDEEEGTVDETHKQCKPSKTKEEKNYTKMDEDFFQNIKKMQSKGDLTEDALSALLASYFEQMEEIKKRKKQDKAFHDLKMKEKLKYRKMMQQAKEDAEEDQRKTEQEIQNDEKKRKEEAKQTATSIVKEHQENAKEIQKIRAREREATDWRLKKKLSMARKKKLTENQIDTPKKDEDTSSARRSKSTKQQSARKFKAPSKYQRDEDDDYDF